MQISMSKEQIKRIIIALRIVCSVNIKQRDRCDIIDDIQKLEEFLQENVYLTKD